MSDHANKCHCSGYSEYRGGGYYEHMIDPEPDCPTHGELITKSGNAVPQRIQRKRTKGWRAPEGAVYVGRGTKWGNPWAVRWDTKLQRWIVKADHNASSERFVTKHDAVASAVAHFAPWAWRLDTAEIRKHLRGKTLMCWCAEDAPCHGDVLLALASGKDV